MLAGMWLVKDLSMAHDRIVSNPSNLSERRSCRNAKEGHLSIMSYHGCSAGQSPETCLEVELPCGSDPRALPGSVQRLRRDVITSPAAKQPKLVNLK